MTYNNLTFLKVHAVLCSTSDSAMYFLIQYEAAFNLLRKQRQKERVYKEHRILKWEHH